MNRDEAQQFIEDLAEGMRARTVYSDSTEDSIREEYGDIWEILMAELYPKTSKRLSEVEKL